MMEQQDGEKRRGHVNIDIHRAIHRVDQSFAELVFTRNVQ